MESQQKQRFRTFVFKNVDAFLIMTILYTVFCVSCPYVNMHSKIKRLETQVLIRVTIRTIFPRCILSRISILPKISKIWLCLCVQTDVCRYDIGSLCFFKRSRGTFESKQYRNPGQDASGKNGKYGHPRLDVKEELQVFIFWENKLKINTLI